jgi:glutathione peroxidase
MMTNPITKQFGFVAIAFASVLSMMALPALADQPASAACPKLLDHRLTSLQENPVDLCQYSGRVVLFVNTASFCANTPQYAKLEKLYEELQPRGLTVVGFPANDFGEQEPGDNKEIAKFCKLTYKVKFPMMEKSGVKRENANPIFKQLIAATGEAPEWNFHKYLVSRDGNTVQSFPALMQPDDPKFMQAVELLLAQPANK